MNDRLVLIEPDYKGFRIEINAVAEGDRWNADVTLRRLFSEDKPHDERVMCYTLTPDLAEHAAEIWARRWVDLNTEQLAREGSLKPEQKRARPHPEDAQLALFLYLAEVFLKEAQLAAKRAKDEEARSDHIGWSGAAATAILVAAAALEAFLSEYVADFAEREVIPESVAGEIRNERDHARQWALLVRQLAPCVFARRQR